MEKDFFPCPKIYMFWGTMTPTLPLNQLPLLILHCAADAVLYFENMYPRPGA
jgi:hypothetical protein